MAGGMEKRRQEDIIDDDNVCNAKVSDNYPGARS